MQSKYTVAIAAKDQFSKSYSDASTAHKTFVKEIKVSQAAIKKLNAEQRNIKLFESSKANLNQLGQDLKGLQAQFKSANQAQAKLVAEHKALSRDKKGNRKEIAALEKKIKLSEKEQATRKQQIKGLTTRYEQEQRQLRAVQRELTKTGIKTDNLSAAQAKLKVRTHKANKALEAQRAHLKKVGEQEKYLADLQNKRMAMTGDVVKVGAGMLAGKAFIDKAGELETAMVEVAKKISFKNISGGDLSGPAQAVKLATLERYILKQAPNLGLQPGELANIVASGAGSNVARSGHELEDLGRFSTLAAKMANAFDELSPESAGKSVAAWKASMGLDMTRIETLAGAINHLSDNSAANTTAMTQVITDVGAVIMSTGMNEIQTASLSAAILAANGNKAEMGRTAAKNLALNLTLGEAASGVQKQMWQSIGLDAEQIAKDTQQEAVGTMYKVFDAIKKQPEYRQAAVIKTLFGTESIGSVLPLVNNMKELQRVMAAGNDEIALQNSLNNEFNKLLETKNFQEQRLSSSLNGIMSAMGEHLLPIYTDGAEALADVISAGTEWIGNNKEVSGVIIKGVAALAALKAAQVAYRLGAVSLDIVMGKRKLKEMQLGASVGKSASKATMAARSMDMLSRSLERVSRRGAAGLAGGLGGDFDSGRSRRGKFGRFATMARRSKLPIVANVAAAGLIASSVADGDNVALSENVGSIGGSMAGAAAGAALGSVVPFIGTIAGGIIGAIAGESLGAWLGRSAAEKLTTKESAGDTAATKVVEAQKQHNVRSVSLNNLTFDEIQSLKGQQSKTLSNIKPLANLQTNSKQEVRIDYSPAIHIAGDADEKKVSQALKASEENLIRRLQSDYPSLFGHGLQDHLDTSLSDGAPGELAY